MPSSFDRPPAPTKTDRPATSTSPPSRVPGVSDPLDGPMGGQRLGHRLGLAAPRCGTRPRDDRQLGEDNRGIFDEDGVGQVGLGPQPDDGATGLAERGLVFVVLPRRQVHVDGRTCEVRQFTVRD